MLRKILQLSACLMIIMTLDIAYADAGENYVIRPCDGLPLEQRVACCQPQLQECLNSAPKNALTPAYACCKKCVMGDVKARPETGLEWNAIRGCQGGRQ